MVRFGGKKAGSGCITGDYVRDDTMGVGVGFQVFLGSQPRIYTNQKTMVNFKNK